MLRGRLFGDNNNNNNNRVVDGKESIMDESDADDVATGLLLLRWLVRIGGAAAGEDSGCTNDGTGTTRGANNNNNNNDDDDDKDPEEVGGSKLLQWTSPITRVPGCVATVHLRTTIRKGQPQQGTNDGRTAVSTLNNHDSNKHVVSVTGTSDALVSRGLVVLLSHILENQTVTSVLQLQPELVTEQLGLRSVLSPGRNDGVASMIRVVQQHLQQYLDMKKDQKMMEGGGATRPSSSSSSMSSIPLYRPRSFDAETSTNAELPSVGLLDHKGSSTNPRRRRVALLLSGGVDSSVALHLLLQQHYVVTCYYLKIWLQDEVQHLGSCPWEDDYRVCTQVCQQANVTLRTVSLQNEYHQSVVQHSIREAELGRTPNPDVLCNSRIKFGVFLKHLEDEEEENGDDHKFEFVASGHYAQVMRDPLTGQAALHRAPDPVKDQSYFLCALDQRQLQRLLFPIGHLQKHQVRELAQQLQLPNRSRPDSQGLCFLGKVKFDDFLASYLGERPGPIVDAATGTRLGTHRGVWYHTVGQRKGIGLYLDPKATSRGPWYVVAKDPRKDLVYCSNAYDESRYTGARSKVAVENVHWLAGAPPPSLSTPAGSHELRHPTSLLMKARHGPKIVSGTLLLDEADPTIGDVQLDQVDSGLAPGQYMVFYNGTECLGGGIISERHWLQFVSGHHRNDALDERIANDTTTREAVAHPM